MEISLSKYYLGDRVYVEYDGGRIVLTTEDGERTTNMIYLENEVVWALVNYIGLVCKQREDGKRALAVADSLKVKDGV